MKKRNEVIATILFCAIMTAGSFSVNAGRKVRMKQAAIIVSTAGKEATEKSVDENPFMAKGDTNIHHDCYNTDTTDAVLPLGIYPEINVSYEKVNANASPAIFFLIRAVMRLYRCLEDLQFGISTQRKRRQSVTFHRHSMMEAAI